MVRIFCAAPTKLVLSITSEYISKDAKNKAGWYKAMLIESLLSSKYLRIENPYQVIGSARQKTS